jgi:hypothetical protein
MNYGLREKNVIRRYPIKEQSAYLKNLPDLFMLSRNISNKNWGTIKELI